MHSNSHHTQNDERPISDSSAANYSGLLSAHGTQDIVPQQWVGSGSSEQLTKGIRWLCITSAIGLLALLVLARTLTPSPAGHGTHQQLGLPPCTAMVLWGVPCPTCGMTTSWAWVVRGNLQEAARANVGGLMLAIIAIGFLPAACYFFITGRTTSSHWFSALLAVSLVSTCCVTLIQWALRLIW